jgi:NAD(P)H dehydrogenase (quinone)
MTTISVIYHTGSGTTGKVAEAVARGAKDDAETTVNVLLVTGDDIKKGRWENEAILTVLDQSDAIIFGAPLYMGSLSGQFKSFMDATGSRWMKLAWKNKVAAGFVNSGGLHGDKLNGLMQLSVFAAQHGMIWSSFPTLPTGAGPDDVNRLSSESGLMTQTPYGADTPPAGDIKTAELFGQRVAEVAIRWTKGLKK